MGNLSALKCDSTPSHRLSSAALQCTELQATQYCSTVHGDAGFRASYRPAAPALLCTEIKKSLRTLSTVQTVPYTSGPNTGITQLKNDMMMKAIITDNQSIIPITQTVEPYILQPDPNSLIIHLAMMHVAKTLRELLLQDYLNNVRFLGGTALQAAFTSVYSLSSRLRKF